jgi:hypothetical protein
MAFRTQKISQMTPKGADLEATDLIEVSTIESGSYVTRSITGQELIDAIPPTTIEWGDIGGTLSAQTDLNTALNGKVPTSRTLTINGVTQDLSADRTFTIATGLTIGTTPIASGTIGRVLFQGTGNVLQQSSSLFFDLVKESLGLGTSDVATPLGANRGLVINGGTADVHLRLQNNNSGTTANDGALLGYSFGEIYLYNLEVGPLIFGTSNTQRMRIQGNGNVLINTTTDAGFRLDVNGTARVQGNTTIGTGAGVELNFQNSTVGLYRSGSALRLGGFSGIEFLASNTALSSQTVRMTLFDTGNLCIGNTLDVASARLIVNSTTQGFLPPRMTTTQRDAIASPAAGLVVYQNTNNLLSLYNGTNWQNVISPNSNGNVLINTTTDAGFRLDVNGTARVNTLTVGLGAGQIATNTVLGFQGLFSNTTGLQNVAIGYQSLYTNTTGGQNIAIGVSSLVFNTTGTGNTSLGDESMLRNTTGARNTAIGQRAGTYAGSGTANNQTSSNSIYLGYQTRASASGATNEVVIGYDALGLGNNTVVLGNTSITKTFLRGTINAANLPTSSAGLSAGDVWNDGGTLKIV